MRSPGGWGCIAQSSQDPPTTAQASQWITRVHTGESKAQYSHWQEQLRPCSVSTFPGTASGAVAGEGSPVTPTMSAKAGPGRRPEGIGWLMPYKVRDRERK